MPAAPDAPEEVLRYLAALDPTAAAALLEKARGLAQPAAADAAVAVDPSAPPPPPPAAVAHAEAQRSRRDPLVLFPTGTCKLCPPQAADEAAVDEERDPAKVKDACQAFVRALEAGNLEAAETIRRDVDFAALVEGGWTCLHWAVHTAGTARGAAADGNDGAAEVNPAEEAALGDHGLTDLLGSGGKSGCGCCAPNPARPGSRGLLERILLDLQRRQGARVDAPSDDGSTPLMFAADAGDREACEWLLLAGADPTAKDGDGDTAADWARAQGHTTLAAWLQQCPKSRGA